jgi:hypothetical protein
MYSVPSINSLHVEFSFTSISSLNSNFIPDWSVLAGRNFRLHGRSRHGEIGPANSTGILAVIKKSFGPAGSKVLLFVISF